MKCKVLAITVLVIIGWSCMSSNASDQEADTIFLNSGGSIKGIVIKEDAAGVEAEIGAGTIVISRGDIKRVEHAPAKALAELRDRWAKDRAALSVQEESLEADRLKRLKAYGEWQEERAKRKTDEGMLEGEVKIARDPDSKAILVNVVLNGQAKALLELDTGASIIVLAKRVGDKLGIDHAIEGGKDVVELNLVGGQTVKARMVVLKSVKVGEVEEKDVLAAILLEEKGPASLKDGLLGRSFLGRFNIEIDAQKMRMSLKKLK